MRNVRVGLCSLTLSCPDLQSLSMLDDGSEPPGALLNQIMNQQAWGGAGSCISNKLPGNAETTGP